MKMLRLKACPSVRSAGRLDVKGLLRATSFDRFLRYHVWLYEGCVRRRMPAAAAAAGRTVEQTLAIIDLEVRGRSNFEVGPGEPRYR